ncbi:MAG: outer membrane protein assembly factor BamD [Bacteroidales bacterium]|nr:outer membrane protein assembly factor BamD [Bacteroidales bacterium]MCF8388031.1 outer membrane protein assembly factor BamD [Bacteroidales bacterium]MCF8398116.1 outer membrane protein assembly factor BamD [Bacteroidales bacterium]
MLKRGPVIILLSTLFLLTSCSKFQKLLKSTDTEMKYEKAIEYYEEGDYYRAMQLFEQLNMIYRGTDKAERLNYYMAYCYYYQEEYIMSAYYFKRYAKSFPNTDRAEECLFMSAYSQYLQSPKYSLDQGSTYEALTELQLFINRYPDSDRVERANELIDDLREKLQKKAFEIAELYFKMEDYQAAITSFENLLKDYPDTDYKEEIYYYILQAYFSYAEFSIEEKKKDRYSKAVEMYEELIYTFPETEFEKNASSVYENSLEELKKLD